MRRLKMSIDGLTVCETMREWPDDSVSKAARPDAIEERD